MKPALFLLVSICALAGCGGNAGNSDKLPAEGPRNATANNPSDASASARKGTRVVVRASDYGRMLFNSNKQAIYIFQRDAKNKSNCYGECARAWPPVYTKGTPRAGKDVKRSLLGSIKRRDGKRQVTYAGKPLYYYAHEGPGQVECHNVNLNGGFWWVIGPNGKRRS